MCAGGEVTQMGFHRTAQHTCLQRAVAFGILGCHVFRHLSLRRLATTVCHLSNNVVSPGAKLARPRSRRLRQLRPRRITVLWLRGG